MFALSDDELERIAGSSDMKSVARRQIVSLRGASATVVLGGVLRVFRTASFARDVTLFLAKRGDVLGAGNLFAQRVGETGAEAIAASNVALIQADAFAALCADNAVPYLSLARNVSYRTSQVYARFERLSRAPAESRVAAALLEICDDFGIPLPGGGHRIELALSQDDLAQFAGTTRATASTVMATLARRGIVRGNRLIDLELVEPQELTRMAEAVV